MSLTVIFRPQAEEDLQKIHKWYNSQQPGLGEQFIHVLERKLEIVREHPESCPVIYKNIRRIILSKFPYLVFYITTESQIIVLAILHAFRDPANWPRS
jgi:plasmid stabilization system protein ParE